MLIQTADHTTIPYTTRTPINQKEHPTNEKKIIKINASMKTRIAKNANFAAVK